MREKPTKTYFGRVLAFMLALSVMLCSFHGCGDDTEESSVLSNGTASSDSASGGGETPSGEEGSSDSSGGSEENTGDSSDGKSTTKKTGGKSTTKKTSSKNTTKKTSTKTTTKKTTTTKKVTTTKSNTYYAPKVYSNSAPGTLTFASSDGTAVMDYSNTASGYVMVKYGGSYANFKVQITGPNGVTQTYTLFSRNTYEALPLTGGSGAYTVLFAVNNGGSSYSVLAQTSISVSLSYSTVAFIRPNIICNYTASTACVQYAAQLTRGCDTDLAKVEAIYKYVVNSISYDHAKASAVSSSAYNPNLASVWSSKKGICYDYASIMAAMLRTQGIPTKVVAGNVSGQYHAWISTWIKGSGWIDGIIYFNGSSWKLMDPTFASTGGSGVDWSNKYTYSVRYVY